MSLQGVDIQKPLRYNGRRVVNNYQLGVIVLRRVGLVFGLVLLFAATLSVGDAHAVNQTEVLKRAQTWTSSRVPYSQARRFLGYRSDCSGFVSYALGLGKPGATTNTLWNVTVTIPKHRLVPGDLLLAPGRHVVMFGGWANSARTSYTAYEQASSVGSTKRVIPYPYYPGHGKYTPRRYIKMSYSSPSAASSVAVASAGRRAASLSGDFSDVWSDDWFSASVTSLVREKIINGYPNGAFKPASGVTRAEFAKMVCIVLGEAPGVSQARSFVDVPTSSWAYAYAEQAQALGIMSGYPDGTFRANRRITRAEIAAVLARALSLTPGAGSLADARSSWASDNISSCVSAGIVRGYPDGAFKPDKTANRAEAATMIERALIHKRN